MSEKHSKLPLIAVFAAAAGLAAYGLTPHKVDVNVISKGVVSDGRGNIVERYLSTDKGRIPMDDTSQFRDPSNELPSQRATCVWSQNWTLKGYLHDCKPD
jgi:hypothetical protein